MADNKPAPDRFAVLRDEPLYRADGEPGGDFDAFDHEAYAAALLALLTENPPPLVVGLFGSWGIGKSTVLNILFSMIRKSKSGGLKPIYFNAWKYSGDSFRRQFLIEVARQVYEGRPDREKHLRRLEQLNYTEVLREESGTTAFESIRRVLTSTVRFRQAGIARILLGTLVLVAALGYAVFPGSRNELFYTFLILLLVFFFKMKFEDLVVVQETPLYDPKLIFPEQFEHEFRDLVKADGPLANARAVIAIDDIDRCEPSTVRDILTSIKTFVGQENCFFIVPCDDKTIVQVFTEPNQKAGYKDEMLRKYFNIGIRMAPLMETDLVDLANSVSKQTNIPQAVVQMAILANCRDPRKLKHFLNTFAIKYAVAKIRQQRGLLPGDIDSNLAGFAKAVLIEDLYPSLFARMVRNPHIYESIEEAALRGQSSPSFIEHGPDDQGEEYGGLLEILKKTRDTRIQNLETVLSLKTSNLESRIPQGVTLKNAIISGDAAAQDIIANIGVEAQRTDLANLLIELLRSETDTFLKNSIAVSLSVWSREDFLSASDRTGLGNRVCFALLRPPGQQVMGLDPAKLWSCAVATGGQYPRLLYDKIVAEVRMIAEIPDGLPALVNATYEASPDCSLLAKALNEKLQLWCHGPKGLSTLLQFPVRTDAKDAEKVPSLEILLAIVNDLTLDDGKVEAQFNRLRKDALFKFWTRAVLGPFLDKLAEILKQDAKDPGGSATRAMFVLDCLLEKPECIESESSTQLLPPIIQLYSRATEAKVKIDAHKVVLLFAALSPDDGSLAAAADNAQKSWSALSDARLREILDFLSHPDDQARKALRMALVTQEMNAARAEIENPTDRTKERIILCYENKSLLEERALEDFVLRAITTSDAAFDVWRPDVPDYARKLGDGIAQQVADKCLGLGAGDCTIGRRRGTFELFAAVLQTVPEAGKPQLLQNYFLTCCSTEKTVRDTAASVMDRVKAVVELQDFRIGVNSLIRDLCDVQPREVPGYQQSFDAALKHQNLFEDRSWRDIAALIKRLLQQTDDVAKAYGLALLPRMPSIPSGEDEDLIRLLVNIARGEDGAAREEADKLLRAMPPTDLTDNARIALEEFLRPKTGAAHEPPGR